MAAAHNLHRRWDYSHKPGRRPHGCNGKYGASGRKKHGRERTTVCQRCRASDAHYKREARRGEKIGRPLKPCGTPAAARRHRVNNEPLDFACKVAEAQYHADRRKEISKTA